MSVHGKAFDNAQAAYDNMAPPDDEEYQCPDCGAEIIKCGDGWCCNESCGWSAHPDFEAMKLLRQ